MRFSISRRDLISAFFPSRLFFGTLADARQKIEEQIFIFSKSWYQVKSESYGGMTIPTIARVMRLTFDATPEAPEPLNDIGQRISVGSKSFSLGGGGGPAWQRGGELYPAEPYIFSWSAKARIHGLPSDNYSDWEIGMLQKVRHYSLSINWADSSGKKRCGGEVANLRDSKDTSIPWFDRVTTSPPFSADGDQRSTRIDDSPFVFDVPYKHPELKGSSGKIEWGVKFVTFLCAHRISDGFNQDAFKPLKSVRWELSLNGDFDGSQSPPVLNASGKTKAENVIDAVRESESPIVGGEIAIDAISKIPECWQSK